MRAQRRQRYGCQDGPSAPARPALLAYETLFANNQNPFAPSPPFVNGLTQALDWTNVIATGGAAIGTQTGATGPPFNDSLLWLVGYHSRQRSQARVKLNGVADAATQEAEVLVRFAGAGHLARGIEWNYSIFGAYEGLVVWNGALNDFTPITSFPGSPIGALQDGWIMRLDAVGSLFTRSMSTDGGLTFTPIGSPVTDTTWIDGSPGIGFWKNGGTNNAAVGFDYWLAQELP